MIEVTSLKLADIKIIKTKKYSDYRGSFSETYREMDFVQAVVAPERPDTVRVFRELR
jgi:dTDP-4-dehydrorhamnose 3,5-epimerase-like enzyme